MCKPSDEHIKKNKNSSAASASVEHKTTFDASTTTPSTSSTSTSTQASPPVVFTDAKAQALAPTHSGQNHCRDTQYDWLICAGPALTLFLSGVTNVWPLYLVAAARYMAVHVVLSLHYQFVDKDNYNNKIAQKQLAREKSEFTTAFMLHMYVQAVLQLIFPSMFFPDVSSSLQDDDGSTATTNLVGTCMLEALVMHIVVVEPLYYAVHRWLHVPTQMKAMHGFHHLSIATLPTTALVQNWQEHFVYIATFGPAFFVPYLVYGRQHWIAIGTYLVAFDVVNAFGHTNLAILRDNVAPWWTSPYSPLKYLFYTPEFHQGHHKYFNANYALFMPIWDYLFGTAREYVKPPQPLLPGTQQDFVFIGHNAGLGHLLSIPELSVYNIYNLYSLIPFVPIKVEMFLMHVIATVTRLFQSFHTCPRYCIANEQIGRIISLCRTPYDYLTSSQQYAQVNADILKLMRQEHCTKGTRYFGLGNLNKMKDLNDGGKDIAQMVAQDAYLANQKIRVWTGDTTTVASLLHQVLDIPNLEQLYYIGAGGKVGKAVCLLLVQARPHLKIRIFSRNHELDHSHISYSSDLSEMAQYKHVLVGKILGDKMYRKAFQNIPSGTAQTRFVLDYTVPALPIATLNNRPENVQHVRVGLLKTTKPNNPFLKGYWDICMATDENHIVPCHFGCILQTHLRFEENEVGDIVLERVEELWKKTKAFGFENVSIDYSNCD